MVVVRAHCYGETPVRTYATQVVALLQLLQPELLFRLHRRTDESAKYYLRMRSKSEVRRSSVESEANVSLSAANSSLSLICSKSQRILITQKCKLISLNGLINLNTRSFNTNL